MESDGTQSLQESAAEVRLQGRFERMSLSERGMDGKWRPVRATPNRQMLALAADLLDALAPYVIECRQATLPKRCDASTVALLAEECCLVFGTRQRSPYVVEEPVSQFKTAPVDFRAEAPRAITAMGMAHYLRGFGSKRRGGGSKE